MRKNILLVIWLIIISFFVFVNTVYAASDVTVYTITVNDGNEVVLKTGETLKIEIKFTGNVTSENDPKMSLKIGNDTINDITGTISGDTITYTYTILEGYKGEITNLTTMGTLKDSEGNIISMTDAFSSFSTRVTVDSTKKTDFSNAKFELKKDGRTGAALEVTGIEVPDGHSFTAFIKSNVSDRPTENENGGSLASYDSNTKTLVFKGIEKYVELNQDLYVFIYERGKRTVENQFVVEGKKLVRFEEPKSTDAFFATFMTSTSDQIVTNFTHDKTNVRKFTISIGKITNNSILQKIKNQDASGMAELLSYAKSNTPITTQTFDTNSLSSIEYNAYNGSTQKVIGVNNVEDKAYYYLYVNGDTENGKYINQEAVTLALSSKLSNGTWSMFFYGANDFKWVDFGGDSTVANKTIPATGKGILLIGVITILTGICIGLYGTNQRYRGI